MFHSRLLGAALAVLVFAAACSRDDAPAVSATAENELLGHVPAGSPYLSGNLQPVPDEVIDRFLQRAEPVLAAMQQELTDLRAKAGTDPDLAGQPGGVALALMDELDGKLNRAGLESLGLDLRANRVFYGLGAFPVFRTGLADAASLRATVQRVLEGSGIAAPQLERESRSYWRIPLAHDGPGSAPAALYIAILDDQLAMGLFPTSMESESLDHLLGLALPGDSNAAERLQAINARFGYTNYGTGEIDLLRLADELMNADSTAGRTFAQAGIDVPAALGEVCRAEIRSIIERAPRAYSGITELDPDTVGYRVVFQAEASLAGELAGLVAPVPTADPASTRILEFALGLKVGALRDFLRNKAAAIAEAPYACEHLQNLNQGASDAFARLNQPIPPFVNNFEGLRASLSQVGHGNASPEQAQGVVAIHVEQPQMFVGMAQMFVPNLAELQLTPGSDPVRLPDGLLPMPGVVAFAALTDHAIGLSVGDGEEKRLQPFLTAGLDAPGTFLSVNYDTATYLDYSRQLADTLGQSDDRADSPHGAGNEVTRALREAYRSVAGRTDTRAAFTPNGLEVSSRMTFN